MSESSYLESLPAPSLDDLQPGIPCKVFWEGEWMSAIVDHAEASTVAVYIDAIDLNCDVLPSVVRVLHGDEQAHDEGESARAASEARYPVGWFIPRETYAAPAARGNEQQRGRGDVPPPRAKKSVRPVQVGRGAQPPRRGPTAPFTAGDVSPPAQSRAPPKLTAEEQAAQARRLREQQEAWLGAMPPRTVTTRPPPAPQVHAAPQQARQVAQAAPPSPPKGKPRKPTQAEQEEMDRKMREKQAAWLGGGSGGAVQKVETVELTEAQKAEKRKLALLSKIASLT